MKETCKNVTRHANLDPVSAPAQVGAESGLLSWGVQSPCSPGERSLTPLLLAWEQKRDQLRRCRLHHTFPVRDVWLRSPKWRSLKEHHLARRRQPDSCIRGSAGVLRCSCRAAEVGSWLSQLGRKGLNSPGEQSQSYLHASWSGSGHLSGGKWTFSLYKE